ncbi:MAG TPA: AtpZ/AtpI family protein [Acidimicrobiales bacterium]
MTDPDDTPPPEDPKPLPGAVAFLSMGLSAAVCVGLGLLLGILVDDALHTAPAFLLVGLALGLALAAMSVVKQVRTYL